MTYTISREDALELKELIEDSVQHYCNDGRMVSGELAWLIVETLAEAKVMEMRGY